MTMPGLADVRPLGPLDGLLARAGIGRIAVWLRASPLTRNGYALVASAGLTSLLGLAFWYLAARSYTVEQLGMGAALISILMTLGNIAQLNLGNMLNRFLPTAGERAGRIIAMSYAAGAGCALLLSAAFLLSVPFFDSLSFLNADSGTATWFVLAAPVWTLFVLQDSVLAGLRKATWVPVENTVYSLAKIGLLFGTAALALGPFAAWTIPLPVIVLAVNGLIFWKALPAVSPASAEKITFRCVTGYLGWDYVGTLAMMTALGAAPLLVLEVAGPAANASYYLAWSVAYSLYLIGRSMGISLLAEAANDIARLPALTAEAVVQGVIPLIAAALLLFLGAPIVMGLFGSEFTGEGVAVLRVLVASTLPWSVVTIYLAAARARGSLRTVAIVQATTLLMVLTLGFILVTRLGALGMALAWLSAHSVVAAGILMREVIASGPDAAIGWSLRLGSSAARLARTFLPGAFDSPRSAGALELGPLLQECGLPQALSWRPLGSLPSQSDGLTICIGDAGQLAGGGIVRGEGLAEGTEALLKIAETPQGVASLSRHVACLEELHRHVDLGELGRLLPQILAVGRTADSIRLIERVIPGEDGRLTLRRRERVPALSAAARAMATLHSATGVIAAIDEGWLRRWIDEPLTGLERAPTMLMSIAQRRIAIARLRDHQRAFWQNRPVRLGLAHGDFSPGNLIFAPNEGGDGRGPAHGNCSLAGITDWDGVRYDAPAGFDACHLALTTRMIVQGDELGPVVRDLLARPFWSGCETAWLAQSGGPEGWPNDPAAVRALVELAWLHHVLANLEKSERYADSRIWLATNVDFVLRAYLLELAPK